MKGQHTGSILMLQEKYSVLVAMSEIAYTSSICIPDCRSTLTENVPQGTDTGCYIPRRTVQRYIRWVSGTYLPASVVPIVQVPT
jgi:hypothetical protein